MRIYNTLSGVKEKLIRPRGRPLKLFVCGPTVYDHAHLGHARTYLVFDILVRWFRHRGLPVFYLQNITDIDDKIIEAGADPRFFEKSYRKDMTALSILTVDRYARASEYLKEIKKQINLLMDLGFAYETSGGVYFEVRKFPDYGRLSRQNLEKLRPGYRIEPDPEKKDPLDFALWKKTADSSGNFVFPGPWGRGRPGWHIEDTAISEKFFGPRYDLHGGGMDLKFPHHEAEIAQEESLSGKKPFVKIWLHTGFLLINGEKMSKSLGNLVTIGDFLQKHSPNLLRFIVLGHHYRSPINYNEGLLEQSQNGLNHLSEFLRAITLKKGGGQLLTRAEKRFRAAMDDDLNTVKALAVLFDFLAKTPKTPAAKKWVFDKLTVLGIKLELPQIPAAVKKLVSQREKLRQRKEFAAADHLRQQIRRLGFEIED